MNSKSSEKKANELIIVGIGASAGGLDAFQKMLPGLPTGSGMSYVIAQHLAPKYRSMLGELLAKQTRMPIEIIQDGASIVADTIYITPPNKDVKLSGNRLFLSKASSIGPKPSIDYFFTSLADSKGAHAVGIILSGTGTDGAHGIRAIKSNDGITIVQSAETARFDGMPRAAIETGNVDLVLPPDRIGPELVSALKYPHLVAEAPDKDVNLDDIGRILQLLNKRTGIDFTEYKTTTIFRRISRRMVLHKLHSLKEYKDYVGNYPAELDVLHKDLLISVTSFFRDSKAFESLAEELQAVFENKKPGDHFRAWVPACSSGEEAYSIAILIAEILGSNLGRYRIQIFATDIDAESVQRARKGSYPLATVMDIDGQRFERYFTHQDNSVTVNKAVRDMVVLAKQNLLKDTPFLHLDLISCRNLLIYLNPELQNKILSLFHYSLDPDGLLFLGKSESVNQRTDLFTSVNSKWKIFRRKQTLVNRMPQLVHKRQSNQLSLLTGKPQQLDRNELWKEREFATSLLSVLGCSAVLTDEQGTIVYIRGDVSPYLRLPEGSVQENLNAIHMARSEIRYSLQSLLHRSKKDNCVVSGHELALNDDKAPQFVKLRVGPVGNGLTERYYLVVFDKIDTKSAVTSAQSTSDEVDESRISELEQELNVTREHLQDTLEELETSSEELQSLNEELQSANEELQASNEELETSNEELQASNEELNTVNQELRIKSDELSAALAELESSEKKYRLLVDNMNEALMACEIELGRNGQPADVIIKQVNKSAEKLLGIDNEELPLRANLVQLPELAAGDILNTFAHVAKGHEPKRFEIQLNKLDKYLTLSVYHLDSGMMGVVCRDDTRRKQQEKALEKHKEDLEALVGERTAELEATVDALQNEAAEHSETALELHKLSKVFMDSTDPIIIEDLQGLIIDLNTTAEDVYGYSREELLGRSFETILPRKEHAPARTLRRRCLDGETVRNWEGLRKDRHGRTYPVLITAFILKGHDEKPESIVTIAKDISSLKAMHQQLEQRAKQLSRLTNELTVAEQRERHKLAKLLHDHLQQLLAGVKLRLETFLHESPTDDHEDLKSAHEMVVESLKTSRSLSAELSPPILFQRGLADALQWLARHMKKRYKLDVDLRLAEDIELEQEELKILLFESVRELLFNVVKHADSNSAIVEMKKDADHVKIKVTDNGVGFDFEAVKDDDDEDAGGFGIFHIRERLELLGGKFHIESSPGKGATMTLISPLHTKARIGKVSEPAEVEETLTTKAQYPLPSENFVENQIQVMLVDDHSVMRDGLYSMISRQPDMAVVGEASNGEEAISQADNIRPHVILMDINMPRVDGIEATRSILSKHPDMRIIGLSMFEAEDQAKPMQEAGAVAYLSKSCSSEELLATIRASMKNRRAN